MSPGDPKLPLFEDADETVAAIHQGDVDAVVVMRALEGPQVILSARRRGALSRAGRAHERRRADRGSGRRHPLCQRPALRIDRLSVLRSGRPRPRFTVRRRTADARSRGHGGGEPVAQSATIAMPVAVWSRPISIANATATLVRLTDLSIHRRAEQIAAAERFARSVLEQATEAVVVLSPDGPHHPRQLARRAARRSSRRSAARFPRRFHSKRRARTRREL